VSRVLEFLREHWARLLLYPLAAFLVLFHMGIPSPPRFGQDWPYLLGGPAGAGVWGLIVVFGRSWPAFFGGYALGAIACAVVVGALGLVTARIKRDWD